MARLRKKTDACVDCTTPIAPNKTSRCRKCAYAFVASSPAFQEARKEAIRRKFREDPAHLAKMQKLARINGSKSRDNPEHLAWLVANGKMLYATILSRPDVRARNVAAIRANSHKITERWLGWCPLEHRAEYRRLTLSKRIHASDARAMIEEQIAAEQKRATATLSPFERQERALANGAKLIANDTAPSPYAAEVKWSVG